MLGKAALGKAVALAYANDNGEGCAAISGFRVVAGAFEDLTEEQRAMMLDLLERNMERVYGAAAWPEAKVLKEKEAEEDDARFVLVLGEGKRELAGLLQYRYVVEEEAAVVYIYELQVDERRRRAGIGRYLVSLAESLGQQARAAAPADAHVRLTKVMLTVHKANTDAAAFYARMQYQVDDISPSKSDPEGDAAGQYDYEILSKPL